MKDYRVTWEIELAASDPVSAARDALAIQRDPRSIATVFDVYLPGNRRALTVDLDKHGLAKHDRPVPLGAKVYVVVKNRGDTTEEINAFDREGPARQLYQRYAKQLGVPYRKKWDAYDWSRSEYRVWWFECEVNAPKDSKRCS